MKTGILETKVKTGKVARRPQQTNGFGAAGGTCATGGQGGGFDNGGDVPEYDFEKKQRVAMLAGLLTMSNFFVLFAGSYVWIWSKSPASWKSFSFSPYVWLGTFFLLASTLAYKTARTAFDEKKYRQAETRFGLAMLMGGVLLAGQILTCIELSLSTLRLLDNPYAIFVYAATIASAVCLLGGIIALGSLTTSIGHNNGHCREYEKRKASFQILGWYWHFVVGVWMGLIFLFNFWK